MARNLTAALRWLLLPAVLLLALAGLFNLVMAPAWIPWQYRRLIAGLMGERGYRYAWLPLAIGLLALLRRRRHPALMTATLAVSLAAFGLLVSPPVQAWWIGRTLPARLAAAFGPAAPDRAPFSVAALFADPPAPVPGEDRYYRGQLRLEILRAVGRSPAPCVIFLHGGGWVDSPGYQDRRPFTFWLVRQGYAVATIAYRGWPGSRWPEAREDVRAAIAFVRAHAAESGIDPGRIVLLGRSAGAQLAEATAYAARDPGIRGVIAFYGPTDLRAMWSPADPSELLRGLTMRQVLETFLGGPPAAVPGAYDSASGLTLAGAASPPTLLLHGGLDTLVPVAQSEALAAKLTAAGRPNLLLEIPWASHAFDTVNFDGPGTQLSTYSIAWFLAAVTR
jgi:acetyl esterase/lipase